jgi:hypothetical protein
LNFGVNKDLLFFLHVPWAILEHPIFAFFFFFCATEI